jgi:histidinol phosphatase-like PHP family hydrolase
MKNTIISFMMAVLLIMPGSQKNIPKIDLHVHLSDEFKGTLDERYADAAAQSRKMGVTFGIAEEICSRDKNRNDSLLALCASAIKKYPLYLGIQVDRQNWQDVYSKETLKKLDYILEDALNFPDKDGKIIRLWEKGVYFNNPEEFMDRYVNYNLKVLSDPITVWVNPTYLPDTLSKDYDKLWTKERRKKLIDAAVKNKIAIEINSRFQVPGKTFIKEAKAAGARFTFGSNQHVTGIGEIEWSVKIAKECGLTAKDFFVPLRKIVHK